MEFKGGLSIKVSAGRKQLIKIGEDMLLMVKTGTDTNHVQLVFQAPKHIKINRVREQTTEEEVNGNK